MSKEALQPYFRSIMSDLKQQGRPGNKKDLAAFFGVWPSTITDWWRGVSPSREKIEEYAQTANIPRCPFLVAAGYVPTADDRAHDEKNFPDSAGTPTGEREKTGNRTLVPTLEETLRRFGTLIDTSNVRVLSSVQCGYLDRETAVGVDLDQIVPHDYAVAAEGNSMEPLFRDGTILLVKAVEEPVIGEANIVLVNGIETCAYVEVEGWGKYALYKENGEYEERIVDAADCVFQGVVVSFTQPPPKKRRRKPEG